MLTDVGMLVAVLIACGIAVVPCHWNSIWADREFTGWVVPIGDRLARGQRLYEDGGHIPVAPLSFVLSRLLFGADGTWIDESLLNFACQARRGQIPSGTPVLLKR